MKPLLKKLLLLGITLLVCALLIEVFFRTYWPYKSIYVPDDQLNYKPKPNFESVYKSPEGDVKFWTNNEGFVNHDPKKEKEPGTTRIFIVGDSFVEALYTEKESHFTTLLQNKLNGLGEKYEVVSYGTSSWGTDNEYKYITTQAIEYSPDVIVLAYYQNDLQNVAASRLFKVEGGNVIPTDVGGTRLGNKIKKLVTRCSFYSSFCSYFQIHAGGFKFLHPILHRLGFSVGEGNASIFEVDYSAQPYLIEPPRQSMEAIEDAWKKTELLINEIRKASEQKGATLVLAYVPAKWEIGEGQYRNFLKNHNLTENEADMNAFRKRLQEISSRNSIQFIDPTDAFAAEEKGGKSLYQSFVHFTKEGDRLFAEELYEGLNEGTKFKKAAETGP
ncbi:SGNH/GDSL hydrolase family protein [Candidatus Woesearchaeota archaeon]|nr:SGNH/GDSL hydrolase family protein [Candidatus Woesearchaeota archaeon]